MMAFIRLWGVHDVWGMAARCQLGKSQGWGVGSCPGRELPGMGRGRDI